LKRFKEFFLKILEKFKAVFGIFRMHGKITRVENLGIFFPVLPKTFGNFGEFYAA
jgi:hypothetical protein